MDTRSSEDGQGAEIRGVWLSDEHSVVLKSLATSVSGSGETERMFDKCGNLCAWLDLKGEEEILVQTQAQSQASAGTSRALVGYSNAVLGFSDRGGREKGLTHLQITIEIQACGTCIPC